MIDGFLGVAQHHENIVRFVQGIGNACVTGFGIEVAENSHGCMRNIQNGHAVDGGAFRGVCGGVGDIVGTDHHGDIAIGKVIIDIFHHVKLFIVDIGFTQQYAHVTGHTAGNGMDSELHFRTAVFQRGGETGHIGLG